MLYLPNNRIKLETSTPKRVLPEATYNSEVQSAPINLEPLSWKQQCWWLEREPPQPDPVVDVAFCGTEEYGREGTVDYPFFGGSTNNYRIDIGGGYMQEPMYEWVNVRNPDDPNDSYYKYRHLAPIQYNNTYIQPQRPFKIIPRTEFQEEMPTIYGPRGMMYNRIYITVAIYVPRTEENKNNYSLVRAKFFGEFGRNYKVTLGNDSTSSYYQLSNVHWDDFHNENDNNGAPTVPPNEFDDNHRHWPLYPRNIYRDNNCSDSLSASDINKKHQTNSKFRFDDINTTSIDALRSIFIDPELSPGANGELRDYVTSPYYKIIPGIKTYICLMLDCDPLESPYSGTANNASSHFYNTPVTNGDYLYGYDFSYNGCYYPIYQREEIKYGSYVYELTNNETNNDNSSYDVKFELSYDIKVEQIGLDEVNAVSRAVGEGCTVFDGISNTFANQKIMFRTTRSNGKTVVPVRGVTVDTHPNTGYVIREQYTEEENPFFGGTCYQMRSYTDLSDILIGGIDLPTIDPDELAKYYGANLINPGL